MANHLMYNCNFCASESKAMLKCASCGYPLSDNVCYFDLFSLKKEFKINKTTLYAAFLALQQQFHPDKFLKRETYNQQDAERASTFINTAFNVLKDDRKRGEYLLKSLNVYVNSARDNVKPEPALLAEIFAKSEVINDSNDIKILNFELNAIQEKILAYFNEFAKNFEQGLLLVAGQNLIAIRYYEKLIIEIQQKLEQF